MEYDLGSETGIEPTESNRIEIGIVKIILDNTKNQRAYHEYPSLLVFQTQMT
jgi:hypothetical protein